jgi:hypothetical protein
MDEKLEARLRNMADREEIRQVLMPTAKPISFSVASPKVRRTCCPQAAISTTSSAATASGELPAA